MGKPSQPLIATETVVVDDENLGIKRKVILGQPVPPDLVDAYRAKVGDAAAEEDPGESGDGTVDYESKSVEALEELADERGLEVEGSGQGGNVLKQDLVDALRADDSE